MAREVWYGALKANQGEGSAVELAHEFQRKAEEEANWFRKVCAEEMGVSAPGGDACHPLRQWLQEIRKFQDGGWGSTAVILDALAARGGALAALAEAARIALKKGEDYNNTGKDPGEERDKYFPLGLASYAQMIHIKSQRLISLASAPREAVHESARDTLLDLINYSSFGADWLKRMKALKEKQDAAHAANIDRLHP